jgi:hypothetical protein
VSRGQDLTIIKHWLERRFAGFDYKVLDVRRGSYGVVWIMETEHDYVAPPRFAIKGFDPEKKIKRLDIDVRALFERELALWLRVPSHRNVLSALGLEWSPRCDVSTLRSRNAGRRSRRPQTSSSGDCSSPTNMRLL